VSRGSGSVSALARRRTALVVVGRIFLATVLWWVLVEGELGGITVALGVVLAAAAASLALLPAERTPRLSLSGFARFVPFFLIQSVRGGVDVARRALAPHLPLQPGYLDYETSLPEGLPRFLFTSAVSLFPGTLAVAPAETDSDSSRLRIHVLDRRLPLTQKLAALEAHVSNMFP
jgi:multicomponent Na+:H+ antiporter subunit E